MEDIECRLFSYKVTKRLHRVIQNSKFPFITKLIIHHLIFKDDASDFESYKYIDFDLIQIIKIQKILKTKILLTRINHQL